MLKAKTKIVAFTSSFVLLFLTFLMGCNIQGQTDPVNNSDSEQNEMSETEEVTTLTLLIDDSGGGVGAREGYEAVAAEVAERFNIATEFVLRPPGAEGDNLIKTRLATDSMEDIFLYNSGSKFNELNPEENLVDLTDEPYMSKIDEAYKQVVSGDDGKVYGVPATFTQIGGWLYNKKIYEKLGLSVPKTWDELMANNEEIKKAGRIPVIQSYETTFTSQLIVLADYYNVQALEPDFADKYTANDAKFASTPAALRSFEKLQEVYEAGYMNEDALATDLDSALRMLAEGDGAHYPLLSAVLLNIAQNFPDKIDDIGLFPQPSDDEEINGLTVWMPNSFYINKNSEKVEAAKQWLEFFVSPEGMEIFMGVVQPEGPPVIQGVELPEDTPAAVKEVMPYFESGNITPALEFLSPIKGPNLEQITVSVGSGMMTAEEGAKEYDDDVVKQAQQLGLPGW